MIEVLCFDCGSMFTVPNMTDQPTMHCPVCKNKYKNIKKNKIVGK